MKKHFYLGLDVSKGYADLIILDQKKEVVVDAFQLDDTFEGHNRLYEVLAGLMKQYPDADLFAAAESTGSYENNWLAALRRMQASLPVQVARVNPTFVRRHAQAEGARTKTDTTSAQQIASYLVSYPEKIDYQQDDDFAGLRAHWTFINGLIKRRGALFNQFESVLYRAFPEMVKVVCTKTPVWALTLLKQYPSAQRLARARAEKVAKIKFVTYERALELIDTAKHSAASACDPYTENIVRTAAEELLHYDALIKRQKEFLSNEFELPEEVHLLKSFGRIGDYTAVGILLEIQAVERFASAKKIASFFGVHPTFSQSGDGLSGIRMSKQGSARMRAILFMIAFNAVQDHPILTPLYRRLVDEQGMGAFSALMGECMGALRGKADGELVSDLLREEIQARA